MPEECELGVAFGGQPREQNLHFRQEFAVVRHVVAELGDESANRLHIVGLFEFGHDPLRDSRLVQIGFGGAPQSLPARHAPMFPRLQKGVVRRQDPANREQAGVPAGFESLQDPGLQERAERGFSRLFLPVPAVMARTVARHLQLAHPVP